MCTRAYYTITKCAHPTTQHGYSARLWYHDGIPAPFHVHGQLHNVANFYGDNWQDCRQRAVAFAKAQITQHYSWQPPAYEMA